MKKLLFSFLVITAFSVNSQAQWVSIPDTNFGKWLNTNGYVACLQGNSQMGWQMDTTCTAVVSEDSIDTRNSNFKNSEGVQYFDNLRYWMGCCGIIEVVPALPRNLVHWECGSNNLSSLPPLPASLLYLECSYNLNLTALPTLPPNLISLICYTSINFPTGLSSLPALPGSLTYLACSGHINSFAGVLPALPSGLKYLYANRLNLTGLPVLPDSLLVLECYQNNLSSLPLLPYGLTQLKCDYNGLAILPPLPTGLQYLTCQNNNMTTLPALPNSLTYLNCYSNDLTDLPELPDSLNSCWIGNNPITCLPQLKRIDNLNFQNTLITCLSNYGNVATSNPPLNTLPLCQPGTPCALPNYVSIPDTNFGTWLNTNGHSSCMIGNNAAGWLMDTTCSAVINAANVFCFSSNITDLTGIQYFDNLSQLNCSFNSLTSLPTLPNGLDSIDFSNNQINSLPALPNSLKFINAYNSQLSSLPALPTSLLEIHCSNNQLMGLPSLPNGLIYLDCSQNQISTLPALPNSLLNFMCALNQITSVPALPDSLVRCWINNNPITCMPLLTRIMDFYFFNTLITCKSNYGRVNNSIPSLASVPLCQPNDTCWIDTVACTGFTVISSHTEATCNGANDGTITLNISGGTPPYTYLSIPIPSGTTTIPGLSAGTYSGNVVDSNGCIFAVSETILEPSALIVTETITDVLCFGANTGAINITTTGGAGFYTYIWNNGQVTEDLASLAAGTYSVTVVDNNACSVSISIVLNSSSPVTLNVTSADLVCFGDSSGSINILVNGGVSPYTYLWNDANTSPNINQLSAGNYSLTVTDNNLCSVSLSVTVSEPPLLNLQVTSATSGALPDTLCAAVTGGTPAYFYNWMGNVNGLPNLCFELLSGAFSFYVTDNNGCTDSFSTNTLCLNNCVWPGDADYNGVADNNDLLPIGLAYGKTGPSRTQQDINWYAHAAQDWIDTIITPGNGNAGDNLITVAVSAGISLGMIVSGSGIASGAVVTSIGGTTLALSKINTSAVSGSITFITPSISAAFNSKQIDCDGNGTINADDTTAILQNFGLMHAKTEDERGWRMTDPALYVDLLPDTTQAGDTLYADLSLGDVNVPATDVYGLAFTLNYDAAVVDSSKTKITFGNSWFGNDTDKISIDKNFHANGQIKCALTRIDHTTRSGYGQIGQASFVITTDNINGKDLAYYQMNVWISDLVMIDNLGNNITVNQGRDSSYVEFEPVGIADIGLRNADLKIQPNPANDEVQILVTEDLVGGELKIMDVEGRILMDYSIQTQNSKLKTQNLSQGIYFIQAVTEKGILTKRLVIAR